MRTSVLMRTEASVAIGTGHAMRCLALAQAWQDAGGAAVFTMSHSTPAVEARLKNEGFEIAPIASRVGDDADAEQTAAQAHAHGASWVVVDGYEFGADYQRSLKNRGLKVLFVDDYGHAENYSADLVLNQNAYAGEHLYRKRDSSTRLLLGPRFALLRREFSQWRGQKREIPATGRNVLITMGGSDPDNFTGKAVDALRAAGGGIQIRVLAGGSNPHIAALEKFNTASGGSIEIVRDATNMPEQMSWADVAVAAAGSTCLEMCVMGLPALLIDLAENQTPIANEFARRGTAYHLGSSKTVTAEQIASETLRLLASAAARTAMSQRGEELVDGCGAGRVAGELLVS